MKIVLQRVLSANVESGGVAVANIKQGYLILLGIKKGDSDNDVNFLAEKIAGLRVFADENQKLNLSLNDINGEVLIVPNFTIYGNAQKGRRPNFDESEKFEPSKILFDKFVSKLKELNVSTQCGIFGADMQVGLINDGPVTLIIQSGE